MNFYVGVLNKCASNLLKIHNIGVNNGIQVFITLQIVVDKLIKLYLKCINARYTPYISPLK